MRHRSTKTSCGILRIWALCVILLMLPTGAFAQANSRTQYSYDVLGRLIRVVYPSGTAITYAYDPAGNLLSRTVGAAPPQGIVVPAGGSLVQSTPGTLLTTRAGYAKVAVTDGGPAPFGIAVFGNEQNGYVVSEAGVPASPPARRVRIFIDYRKDVPSGGGANKLSLIATGFAISNPGSAASNLTLTLRDRSGSTIASGQGSLAAGAHVAKFIFEHLDVAPNFKLPDNFPTAVKFGSLEIEGSQPVSVVALRLTVNQREETLLTSTPVADLSEPLNTSPLYFPQFVDGGGYKTMLILLNTSNAAETGTLAMFGDDGSPLSARDWNGTSGTSFPYSIPAAGTFVLETDGSASGVNIGWVRATPTSGSAPVGSGVFSYTPGTVLVTESGVPTAVPTTRARIYVDKSGGHDTGIAVANPGSSRNNVSVRAFGNDGTTPAGSGPGAFELAANGHRGRFAGEMIPGLPGGFTGVMEITSPSPFVALTLRSLVNGRGEFLITSFPVADANRNAPSPIVFPQIVDGGGGNNPKYVTQFILLSATASSTVTVDNIWDP